MNMKKILAGCMALTLLTGCGTDSAPDQPADQAEAQTAAQTSELTAEQTAEQTAESTAAQTGDPQQQDDAPQDDELPDDETQEVTPQNVSLRDDSAFRLSQYQFAYELMRRVQDSQSGSNVMISPYSVANALTMCAVGADGKTRTQMEQVLGGGLPIKTFSEKLASWCSAQPDSDTCKLKTANSIWMREKDNNVDFEVFPDYLEQVQNVFHAEAFTVPFNQETVTNINNWVSEHTDHMIPKIIDNLDELERMVLVNAVYFDAKWDKAYDDEKIEEQYIFSNADGSESKVEMMFSAETAYIELDGARGFLRKYDGPYAFVGILPPEGVSAEDWLHTVNGEQLMKMIDKQRSAYVDAGLPAFTYDTTAAMPEMLSDMGIQDAFSEDLAEFPLISEEPLHISDVLHRSHIEVDREGTKAAAATAVKMRTNAVAIEPEHITITLDRPFVYMILDTSSNIPVFIGTVQQMP